MRIHYTALLGAMGTLAISGTGTQAQVPGVPVLQNAFANRGLAIAANFGAGAGQSFYGAAASWGLGSGRLQVSGAAGAQRANDVTRGAYGGRLAASLWTSSGGALGAGAFVGIGGGPRTRSSSLVTNPAVMTVPVGLSIGYQRPFGSSRGFSVYASPFYRWERTDSATVETSGVFRASLGLDLAFSQSFGASIGTELGTGSGSRSRSGTFGAAITFVPGRR